MLVAPLHSQSDARIGAASNYTALFGVVLQLADLFAVALAGAGAHWLRFGQPMALDDVRHIAIGVLFTALVFGTSPLYRDWRAMGAANEALRVLRMWSIAFAATVVFAVALKFANEVSRIWWVAWYVASIVGLLSVRLACRSALVLVRRSGLDVRSAVVVGGPPLVRRIIDTFRVERWAGVQVRGWFTTLDRTSAESTQLLGGTAAFLGDLADLPGYVEEHGVQEVWLALPLSAQNEIDAILEGLRHSTADVKLVPDLFGLRLLHQGVGQIAGLPFIELRGTPVNGQGRLLKAIEDRVIALLILIVITPLLLTIAVAVKFSSPGPVLFRQQRHGRDGKVIEVWKFRSMYVHEEVPMQLTQARMADRRVSNLGRFLRRTSLDELPQFFNVLQGTMSIVGPRPHALVHNDQYKDIVQDYMQRHRVKPGITGWAQVNGLRGETDTLEKMAQRVEYDLFYIQNWSVLLDMRIIIRTIFTGFTGKNAY